MTPRALLEFAYLRSEADNSYTLFLRVDPSILGQEIEIGLTDERQLSLELEDGALLITRTLPADIYHSLSHQQTTVIFANDEGEPLAMHVSNPLRTKSRP